MKFLLLLLIPATVLAAPDPIAAARSALDDGLPQVAISRLDTSFPRIRKGRDDATATVLLARALCEAGRPSEAEKLLRALGTPQKTETKFWLAQALAGLGKFTEAQSLYEAVADASDPVLSNLATIGVANMQSELGQPESAAATLARAKQWPPGTGRAEALLALATLSLDLGQPESAKSALDAAGDFPHHLRPVADYVTARWLAATGEPVAAANRFAALKPVSNAMAVSAVVGHAAALEQSGALADAENLLEEFLEKHPTIPELDAVFTSLDLVYSKNPAPASSELRRWSDDPLASPRRTLALFYRARLERRLGQPEAALQLLKTFVSTAPDHTLANRAAVELASASIEAGRPADAIAVLPPLGKTPDADFVRGLALQALGKSSDASSAFASAATNEALAETALFNAALCELQIPRKTRNSLSELKRRFPASSKLDRFELLAGFDAAAKNDPTAAKRLSALASLPDSPVAAPAALALAEWSFSRGDRASAALALRSVSADLDPARQATLSIFLADSGDAASTDSAIDAANKFLKAFPGSATEPDVHLKLGELLFRRGDFGAARMQFETLARSAAGTRFEEPALFLAAQSASRLLDANGASESMLLYEEVAGMNGPFAARARLEQAVLQNALGRPAEAIAILDKIIADQPDAETRAATLMEKGKTQFLQGSKNPATFSDAISTWKLIASDPALSANWKNQALARTAAAHEKLGNSDAAIAAFYETTRPGDQADGEYFWFYKAGFDAARLLETQTRWQEAVRIYEILAATDGPRVDEARQRINKIQLENFLWDDQ